MTSDPFRDRVGWKGEYELFKRGMDQHKERTGHEPDKVECDFCKMITKHMLRLFEEGNQLVKEIEKG